jgi:tetratricopeptide (TPR) repeat protein
MPTEPVKLSPFVQSRRLWIYDRCLRSAVLAFLTVCVFAVSGHAKPYRVMVEEITVSSDSPTIKIRLNRPAQYRAVRLDRREVMVALKDVKLSSKVLEMAASGKQIRIDHMPGNALGIIIQLAADVTDIQTTWDKNVNTLTIGKGSTSVESVGGKLESAPRVSPPVPVEKASEQSGDFVLPAEIPMTLGKTSPAASTGIKGDADDLLFLIGETPCPQQPNLMDALVLCREKKWLKAFQTLKTDQQPRSGNQCEEKVYYLRAYAYYKLNTQADEQLFLETINFFQDAISYFPSSPYAPYAMAIIGKIYKSLKNYAEAKGYFKIILEKNKDYKGRPEIMFELGKIHALEKNFKLCITTFKDFLAEFPESSYALDAKLELGRALYDSNRYNEALEMFSSLLKSDPQQALERSDLLFDTGNCYYQLGKFPEAREMLIKSFNFFSNPNTNSITLSRIADTYRDTGQPDRANKLYQLVMDRYPETDGYVICAMRRAALLENREEREGIYQTIVTKFPNHPMVRLAQLKLADLKLSAGEFRKSLETIRPLVASAPKELLAEVYYILHASFKGLFSELFSSAAYTEVIALYQKESGLLRRFPQPETFRTIGSAYLQSHMYEEAAKLLLMAEKAFAGEIPADLYFELGTALQESGDSAQALARFQLYVQRAPQGNYLSTSYLRMAKGEMGQGNFQAALEMLKKATQLSKDGAEKIAIFRLSADAFQKAGDLKMAADALSQATHLMENASEKDPVTMGETYQRLAEIRMKLKMYSEATSDFGRAIENSGGNPPPGLLVQLGEAYIKAGQDDRAVKTFIQVKAMEDEFWSNLASERLQRMKVENRIQADNAKR